MELLNTLLWKEEEVFAKVEEILGATPFKDPLNYTYWDNGHKLTLCAHIDKVSGYSTSKHKWEWNKTTNKMEEVVQIAIEKKQEVELERYINIVYNKNGILGADDRAGIIVILYVMEYCKKNDIPMPNVLLTNHEESGGAGMKAFIAQCDKELMEQVNLIVALDRRGSVDYVYYNEPDKEVRVYVEMFGFIKATGSYSDCKDLTDAWEIPSINLSVGYYNAHTKGEELHLDETLLTANRVIEMMHYPIEKRYGVEKKKVYEYTENQWDGYGSYWNRGGHGWMGRDNNVSYIGEKCIPRGDLDRLLTEVEIAQGWRVVCDAWEHYAAENWIKVLYEKDSNEYQIESFHIYSTFPVKYVRVQTPPDSKEFYLVVKFKTAKEYEKLQEQRWTLDYGKINDDDDKDGDKEGDKDVPVDDAADAEGFRSIMEEEKARLLLEYKQDQDNPYCLAFYTGECDGRCGGDVGYCDNESARA